MRSEELAAIEAAIRPRLNPAAILCQRAGPAVVHLQAPSDRLPAQSDRRPARRRQPPADPAPRQARVGGTRLRLAREKQRLLPQAQLVQPPSPLPPAEELPGPSPLLRKLPVLRARTAVKLSAASRRVSALPRQGRPDLREPSHRMEACLGRQKAQQRRPRSLRCPHPPASVWTPELRPPIPVREQVARIPPRAPRRTSRHSASPTGDPPPPARRARCRRSRSLDQAVHSPGFRRQALWSQPRSPLGKAESPVPAGAYH